MQGSFRWRGPVRLEVRQGAIPGLRLRGACDPARSVLLVDLFGIEGCALKGLPAELMSARLGALDSGSGRWRLSDERGYACEFDATRVIAHRDVESAALAAIPPRPVPLRRRAFWWLVLTAMRWPISRRWVLARYARSR